MTYTETQPPVHITRDEARDIAMVAWSVLDDQPRENLSPMARATMRKQLKEKARNVISWCDGTLLSGENDAYDPPREIPLTLEVKGWYTRDLAAKLDLTPQHVLDAHPLDVYLLQQVADFIDDQFLGQPTYSIEARLEAIADYDRIMARLQRHTTEYIAEVAAEEKGDDEIEADDDTIIRSTNVTHE